MKRIEQRPRQAFEDFGLRTKTALFLSLPIFAGWIGYLSGWKNSIYYLLGLSVISIAVATAGRLRGTAQKYFPWPVCFSAPLWILERAVSTYWALCWYFARGGYPFGDKILSKGIGRDWIK